MLCCWKVKLDKVAGLVWLTKGRCECKVFVYNGVREIMHVHVYYNMSKWLIYFVMILAFCQLCYLSIISVHKDRGVGWSNTESGETTPK